MYLGISSLKDHSSIFFSITITLDDAMKISKRGI